MRLRPATLRLSAVVAAAGTLTCARQSPPPGGPPDNRPPVVVSVSPDTFATVEPGRGTNIRMAFDERISEQVEGGTLDGAVELSPRTGEVRVEHARDALEVSVGGGLRPGLVYRVRLRPVVRDMFGNQMRVPFEWVFSTGADFEPNAVAGYVWDRVTGEMVEDVQVELRPGTPDQPGFDTLPAHATVTDTAGVFTLRYVPAGTYTLVAYQDRNRNLGPDVFEPQATRTGIRVSAADTVLTEAAVMVPDTTAPRLVRIEAVDSVTLRVSMDDPLDPGAPLQGTVPGIFREEGDAPSVERILHEHEWRERLDSLAAADSLAAPPPAADTGLAPDTGQVADTGRVAAPRQPAAARPGARAGAGPQPVTILPDGTPAPSTSFVVRLRAPLEPGEAYTVRVQDVVNLAGLVSASEEAVVTLPPPPEAQTTPPATPPDTGRVARAARRR